MKKYTVDRIEDGIAVLLLREDEAIERNVPASHLPLNVKEGDIVKASIKADGNIDEIQILKDETSTALNKAESLLKKLKNKNKNN